MFLTPRTTLLAALAFLIMSTVCAQQPTPTVVSYSESIPYKPRLFKVKPDKKKQDKNAKATPAVQPQPAEKMPGNGPVVTEDSPITIPVSVFDSQGNFVTDLKRENFKVYIDGPEAVIISVKHRTEPLNVLLVIDTSASSLEVLDSAKRLATSMADQFSANDKISVLRFSDSLKQLVPLTNDQKTIRTAIDKIDEKGLSGGTSLYDITAELFDKYVPAPSGRTVVLLLTDGVDTTSRRTRYSEALMEAEKSDVSVFPVYLDTFNAAPRPRVQGINIASLPWDVQQVLNAGRFSAPGSSEAEYALGRLYLNDLVYLSGGRAIDANSLLNGKTKVATNIADEIRQQYYVTYKPAGSAYIGQRKHLKVRVDRPNLAVIARGSYIVGSPPSAAPVK